MVECRFEDIHLFEEIHPFVDKPPALEHAQFEDTMDNGDDDGDGGDDSSPFPDIPGENNRPSYQDSQLSSPDDLIAEHLPSEPLPSEPLPSCLENRPAFAESLLYLVNCQYIVSFPK